jgi:hypothetical protein
MPKKLSNKKEISTYICTHIWVKSHYGKASKCEKCSNPNNYRYEWANISGEYKRERSDWMELCQSCHRLYDKPRCKNGHEFTPENTYIRPSGHRACRACHRVRKKIYNRKKRKNAMG